MGVNVPVSNLKKEHDVILLTGGSTIPRNLPIPGRDLKGVHFAMEFLEQKNKQVDGYRDFPNEIITAFDKNVVVIGGGDTGADCVGTSNREKAKSITQIELLTKPPTNRHESTPWPNWPMQLRTSTSHEEGADRQWAVLTKEFIGDENGNLTGVKLVNIEWKKDPDTGRNSFFEIEGTERIISCELALIAVGFLHPQHKGMLEEMGVELDNRGNVAATDYQTSVPNVFAAGDMRRGQSLVVWAIGEGREAAVAIDQFLTGSTSVLEEKDSASMLV